MNCPQLDELCTALTTAFRRDERGTGVAALLETYARTCGDWPVYGNFQADHYTRNLVHECAQYELLILCWNAGQASPIHNHEGQRCWMGVLDGRVRETHFKAPRDGAQGPLTPGAARVFEQGQVAYIHDEIALHEIRPEPAEASASAGEGAGRAVTLHLYAQPIRTCRLYCPDTGRITRKTLAYDTVRGEPVLPPA